MTVRTFEKKLKKDDEGAISLLKDTHRENTSSSKI